MMNNMELNVTVNGERLDDDFDDDEFSEDFDINFDEENEQ
jgi:hypothetical protein